MTSSTGKNADSFKITDQSSLDLQISVDEKDDNIIHSSEIIHNFKLMPEFLDDKVIPDLTNINPWPATEAVADLLGIFDDETNLKSFWIVDTLAHSLKQMQDQGVQQTNQKAFVYWFFYILENIHVHDWSREETFTKLKELLLRAEKIVFFQSEKIPAPQDCSDIIVIVDPRSSKMEGGEMDEKYQISEIVREKNSTDLSILIDLIYKIFANQFKYEVIRSTFANITRWESIEISNAINIPRTLRVEPTEKIARKEQGKRRPKSGKEVLVVTGVDDNSEEHIQPLLKSVDQKFFDKLFPNVSSAKKNKTKKDKSKKKI
ncbi:uncharacterized protein LOC111047513 isoform X1 [Nilaparvata lugens]|uniref:uncharacterized protein LOC111047513 isoform X1 n=1 Tax=Nilaparvata lugens TaxID=108931 RepID=UPI00193E838D|nr:uncharacterized protein LOC111047513 isoform X1 [Nilaparvata lugens]